jgi:uncharacterized membrane protein YphA (DoxX/SURF4 family)
VRGGAHRPLFYTIAAAILGGGVADAHERFVKHNLKHPLKLEFFGRFPDHWLGLHPSILREGRNVAAVLFAFLFLWFSRASLVQLVQENLLTRIGGRVQRAVHLVACFITDRPVKNRLWHNFGQWALIMFLRSPGLVLMYSATNDSLVMPSYPLDPVSATFFKFAQVFLAILILTQTALPLCGALIFGTWIYLVRWGWMVSVDALPVLTVAVVYVTSPWQSHRLAITEMNATQVRWVRLLLGFGFMALGWLKVYNHNLVAGVADNFPAVMNDPMIKFFAAGTDPTYRREAWVIAFGLAEVLSGFLVMVGVFTRLWAALMIVVFTKLMLVDFGWDEIPHIYPIGALAAVMFSNKLRSEFWKVEEWKDEARRKGEFTKQVMAVGLPALGIAVVVVFPLLYLISFFDRSNL